MKNALLSILCAACVGTQAQTTALDFTANDCAGTSHNLFTELDAGNVVILELVMMGCQPCITAGHSITDNVLPSVSEPARVKLYSIGFTNSINCTQMNDWKTTNGFTHTVFAGMSTQTTHYNGMGMPTLAVVGGAEHTVYYTALGHSSTDNEDILAAIETALAAQVGIAENSGVEVALRPNPTSDLIALADKRWNRATISDMQGRTVASASIIASTVDVTALPPGMYVMHLTDANGSQGNARFEKR